MALTREDHGSGTGTAVLVVLAAAAARPVIHAAIEVLDVLLIVVAVLVGAGITGLVALLTWRGHRTHPHAARVRSPLSQKLARAAPPLPEPGQAIEWPVEVHLHLHGVAAAEIAASLNWEDR
jgi:hypothetical protein